MARLFSLSSYASIAPNCMISAPLPAMHRLCLRMSVSLVVGMVRAWIQQEGKYLWRFLGYIFDSSL